MALILGILSIDDNNHLQSIIEISLINKKDLNDLHLDNNTLVSMNLWGFTPIIFDLINLECQNSKITYLILPLKNFTYQQR